MVELGSLKARAWVRSPLCLPINKRMAKIIPFTLRSSKSKTGLTSKQAIDRIVTAMVIEVMPVWIEREWSFLSLELLAKQLREGMMERAPEDNIDPNNVNAIIVELKPVWQEIINIASEIM